MVTLQCNQYSAIMRADLLLAILSLIQVIISIIVRADVELFSHVCPCRTSGAIYIL